MRLGLERLRPSLIAPVLGVDVRRVHDALRRLEARGLVRRVARGIYALAAKESDQGKTRKTAIDSTGAPGPGPARHPWLYPWLGPLERRILSYVHDSGLWFFTLSEVVRALKVDRRSAWQSLRKLSRRGLVRKVARGLYVLAADPDWLAALPVRPAVPGLSQLPKENPIDSPKAAHGTRGPAARGPPTVLPAGLPWPPLGPCVPLLPPEPPLGPDALLQIARAVLRYAPIPLEVDGPRYDNVRGYTHEGRYVEGDRGRVLRREDLVFLDRASHAEVQFLVRGLGGLSGEFAAYTNLSQDGPDTFRAEFRPRSGFVKKYGIDGAVREAYVEMAGKIYAYTYIELLSGPPDVIWWLVRYVAPLYVSLYLAVAAA